MRPTSLFHVETNSRYSKETKLAKIKKVPEFPGQVKTRSFLFIDSGHRKKKKEPSNEFIGGVGKRQEAGQGNSLYNSCRLVTE